MKQNMDKIQFESRLEISDILLVLERYKRAYPEDKDNKTLNRLYDLLSVMEIEW